MIGMTAGEWSGTIPLVELYPDNVLPLRVFEAAMTQWNVGANGVVGLNYLSVGFLMKHFKISKLDRSDVFYGVMVLERCALASFKRD